MTGGEGVWAGGSEIRPYTLDQGKESDNCPESGIGLIRGDRGTRKL
ncbi:MAG: hypothetical protein PHU23_03940 [Dehalococcoidales bacterium]|nr:hypothetical protein [Dehalococcoidales bacterium]